MRGYAEGTVVSVEKSQAQIQSLVRAHGATMFTTGWLAAGEAAVEFTIKGRRVRFTLAAPKGKGSKAGFEAEERRRWRCLLLAIRAKLEIVASGISEFDEEFLAHVVTANGQTVWRQAQAAKMLPAVGETTP